MRRYTKLCRMIARGITAFGGTTPLSAIINAIRGQYQLRKRWRANRTRQPGESEEGDGALSLAKIREMAAESRCPFSIKLVGTALGSRGTAGSYRLRPTMRTFRRSTLCVLSLALSTPLRWRAVGRSSRLRTSPAYLLVEGSSTGTQWWLWPACCCGEHLTRRGRTSKRSSGTWTRQWCLAKLCNTGLHSMLSVWRGCERKLTSFFRLPVLNSWTKPSVAALLASARCPL